jgi:ribose/xylose/arabinose/galactoside ABC-type transport system permease subunit
MSRHRPLLFALAALVVLFAVYIGIHPRGFSVYVVTIWSNQGALLGLAAIAQFFVVLVRGIDLSVGPVVALTNVAASYLLHGGSMQIIAGTLGVLALGAACGLANGAAVVFARVQPIVATLASGAVFGGVALLLRPLPGGTIDDSLSDALTYDIAGVPTSLVILLALTIAVTLPLRRTRIGLAMCAVGSAEAAAFLTGTRVAAARLVAYALGGVFASLAGLYVAMVTQTGDAGVAPAYTLNSIAAVVLGGVPLSGGLGAPVGAVAGALILKTVSSLMFFSGLPPLAQPFFEGLVLAIAIFIGAAGMLRLRSRLEAYER